MEEKTELAWPLAPSPLELMYVIDIRKRLLESQERLFMVNGHVEAHVAWVDREGVSLLQPRADR